MRSSLLFLLCCLFEVFLQLTCVAQTPDKPNIIFIIIDDLNDYTETLAGHPQAITPGINRIENLGTTFLNAYTSSPKCAPSRTSFITGKDLAYTQVYNNPSCKPFRDYFKPSLDNDEVYTLPEYLKDYGGYFTYGINKIYHCFETDYDYDDITADPCEKTLSWNKYSLFFNGDDSIITHTGNDLSDGVNGMEWAQIPDSLEHYMYDKRSVDSAVYFIHQVVNGEINTCERPFFMMIGLRKPHLAWFIPEHYYMDDYIDDYYAEPFNLPYNQPYNASPANGVIMPPQPEIIYGDYENLPEGGLAKYMAKYDSCYFDMLDQILDLDPLPEIDPDLSDDERISILENTIHANAVMAYLAATKSTDAQINRLMDSLEQYPEIYANTILVVLSDHGYSLGEKKHWQKGTLWETDLRVPLVISDLRNPIQQVVEQPVSLLDIFPTICDLTETCYPVFTDSSNYLDGKSIVPFLQNPDLNINKPSLSTYKESGAGAKQCNCFPQLSVRDQDFHYIYYTSNNADWLEDCNGPASWHEAELYLIGKQHEKDPNEWNNLINDSIYVPIVNYLQQWLPDSAMYLRTPFTAEIQSNEMNCLLTHSDTLELNMQIFDTTGIAITPPENYIYQWSNNLTNEITFGTSAEFLLQTIPDVVYESEKQIVFILQMIDTNSNVIVAIDHKEFYLNPENTPEIFFSLSIDSLTVSVTDIELSGDYQSVNWDFGDGFISSDPAPGPHTYAVNGTYTLICTVTYGNDAECTTDYSKTFTPVYIPFFNGLLTVLKPLHGKPNAINTDRGLNANAISPEEINFNLFPSPADSYLIINCNKLIADANLQIIDATGRVVLTSHIKNSNHLELDISNLPSGSFILKVSYAQSGWSEMFQIVR